MFLPFFRFIKKHVFQGAVYCLFGDCAPRPPFLKKHFGGEFDSKFSNHVFQSTVPRGFAPKTVDPGGRTFFIFKSPPGRGVFREILGVDRFSKTDPRGGKSYGKSRFSADFGRFGPFRPFLALFGTFGRKNRGLNPPNSTFLAVFALCLHLLFVKIHLVQFL